MGEILIFRIPPRNLKQLELSGNIDPSPHPSAHPLSLSRHAAQTLFHEQARSFTAPLHSPIAPTKSGNTLNSTSYHTPRTRAQPPNASGTDHLSAMSHAPSQTFYDSRRECVAGVNSSTLNPFSPFTSTNQPLKGVKLPASDSQPEQMTAYSPDAYLHYSPLPPNPSAKDKGNYTKCLYKLGFKQEQAEKGPYHELIKDLRAYLEGTAYFYLRKGDNPAAFKTLVLEFLKEYGPKYWGHSQRQRLEEEEPCKGYLYPRDVQRGESAFLDAVEYLFDYKASCSQYYDTRKYIDFAAMSGRRVDAQALADIKNIARSTSNNKASSGPSVNLKDARPKKRRRVTSDSEDDSGRARAWNIFDQKETETALRPNPAGTKWTRGLSNSTEAPRDDVQRHEKPDRPKKHSRRHYSNVNHGTSQKRRETQSLNTCPHENLSTDSSTDSDTPLLPSKNTKKHRPSPPKTGDQTLANAQTASMAPGRVSRPSFISLVSDSDEERPRTIKNEPLSVSARAGTLLKVSMHNQPEKLEISVPLGACQTSNQLFDQLTTEWRLRPEMANKINFISARFRWSGEPHGMRRGEASDWELFCTTIREAWDKKEGDVKEKCIIEMKLIADD